MGKPIKVFSVDARAILTLGRDSIKDHTTAVLELVKNSYDADATQVEIDITCNSDPRSIRIADNGCGMTEREVDTYWLRIGYSEKRIEKTSRLNRRKTGEKGIGRISSDRLGAVLELYTKAVGKQPYALRVNWDDFNVDGKDLSSIGIEVLERQQVKPPKVRKKVVKSGTELVIKDLRQIWTKKDIEELYDELSILTPPFRKVKDFEIFLNTDVAEEFCKKIESPFYKASDISLEAKYDGNSKITYSISDRESPDSDRRKRDETVAWTHLIQRAKSSTNHEISLTPQIGPVSLSLLFYPRKAEILEGTSFRLSDLREFLDKNAGVKIYRDYVRVKPYGNPEDPEGDWLGLGERKTREPAGIARPEWKVTPNQIVGAVFVGRDHNANLTDSSSREGLIKGDAFNDLRAFVLGCITLLETHRHDKYKIMEGNKKKKVSPTEDVRDLSRELRTLRSDLKLMKSQVQTVSARPMKRTLDQVVVVDEKIKETEKSLEELVSQARVLRGLATIGIAAAVFGHETQSAMSEFIGATYTASSILKKKSSNIDLAIDELNKAEKYANQVSAWGAFALARVQRDKRQRKKINFGKVAESTIQDIEPVFTAAKIDIAKKFDKVEGRSFAMDIETVLLNLMTNAYTACLQVRRSRNIRVEVNVRRVRNSNGVEIVVADSGPGVDVRFKNRIWDPLFSTKVDREGKQIGTGLGLAIVDSVVKDLAGERRVDADSELGGAKFSVWVPIG